MAKIYLGVRIPEKSYGCVTLENIDLHKDVTYLKDEISKKIDFPKDEIELIYCGSVMDNNESMSELNVSPDSTVHVFKKTTKPKPYVPSKTYTDEDCQKIAELFSPVTAAQINVNTRIIILRKIINEYPEFRKNLGAQALIRDSVLFHALDKIEVIKKIAQNYSIICEAAEFIVKTTKREIAKNEFVPYIEESMSDMTSSSEEENSLTQNDISRMRRISRDQLAAALMMAGSASLNSLSNIAQRNANLAEEQQRDTPQQNPPSSSATTSTPVRITSSLVRNALQRALMSTTRNGSEQSQSMDTSEPVTPTNNVPPEQPSRSEFTAELQLMREMGLNDEAENYRALLVCNGEVEAAVNLVLGLNRFFQ